MYHFRIQWPCRAVAPATKVSWKWTLYQNLQNSTARKTILKYLGNLLSFWRNRRSNIRMLKLRSGLAHFSNWFNDDMKKWVKSYFFIFKFIKIAEWTHVNHLGFGMVWEWLFVVRFIHLLWLFEVWSPTFDSRLINKA